MCDHLLESPQRDDSNKWSNIGFGEEITQVELIEVNLTMLINSSGKTPIPPEKGTHMTSVTQKGNFGHYT